MASAHGIRGRLLALVFLGGSLGTLLRVLILQVGNYEGSSGQIALFRETSWVSLIPWPLIAVNTIGVAVACLLLARSKGRLSRVEYRAFLLPGILGGLTSYSGLISSCHTIYAVSKLGSLLILAGSLLAGVLAGSLALRMSR